MIELRTGDRRAAFAVPFNVYDPALPYVSPMWSDLDRLLWTHNSESFLPHAQLGAGQDERQPVLIAGEVNAANRARTIALVDGRWRDEALDFDRVLHFFDENSIAAARVAYRALKGRQGVEPRYWKQNEAGRWEQAA